MSPSLWYLPLGGQSTEEGGLSKNKPINRVNVSCVRTLLIVPVQSDGESPIMLLYIGMTGRIMIVAQSFSHFGVNKTLQSVQREDLFFTLYKQS